MVEPVLKGLPVLYESLFEAMKSNVPAGEGMIQHGPKSNVPDTRLEAALMSENI